MTTEQQNNKKKLNREQKKIFIAGFLYFIRMSEWESESVTVVWEEMSIYSNLH